MSKEKLIVILGATASGKSALAIKLAKKFNGEIVSADSRQVYKGMNIGTGKVTKKEKSGIPHHLINLVSLNQEFNVAIYKGLAIQTIKNIQKKGKLPFLVGGTGLYIGAVVDNIEFPKVSPQRELRGELEKKSAKELFEIYQKLDPEGAKFIEKENKRRLIRAIEVCKVTGESFLKQRKRGKPLFDVLQIGIKLGKEKLREKVSKRVKEMLKKGLEEEVKKLTKRYGFEIPPLQTIGYQEWLPYFKEEISENELKEKIKIHTLQFAKRQMTWFKRDKRINWLKNQKEAEKLIKKFISNKSL